MSEPDGPEDELDGESVEFSEQPEDEGPDYARFDCTDASADHTEAAETARRAVEAGECIVLPTDTVYGIGADAFSSDAVQRLLNAKERGRDMPPPVLIGETSLIRALATEVPKQASDLVAKHWPGALTIICKIQPSLTMDLGDAAGTIALRVPDHELAREVLRRTGPLAVSSANLSGRPAALTCDDAVAQLGESVSVYLDGGTLGGGDGRPSTIVDFTQHETGEVLRRGALSVRELRETLPALIDLTDDEPEDDDTSAEPVEALGHDDTSAEPVEAPGRDGPSTGSGHEDDAPGHDDTSAEPVEALGHDGPSTGSGHEDEGSGHEDEAPGREGEGSGQEDEGSGREEDEGREVIPPRA